MIHPSGSRRRAPLRSARRTALNVSMMSGAGTDSGMAMSLVSYAKGYAETLVGRANAVKDPPVVSVPLPRRSYYPPGMRTIAMRRIVRPALLLLVIGALTPVATGAVDPSTLALLLVTHQGPRGFPPTATTFRFTGLAADNATVLFGPVTKPAASRLALVLPGTVQILKIDYLAGATL